MLVCNWSDVFVSIHVGCPHATNGFTFNTSTSVQFGSLKKNGANGFKFLFERLGGFQMRHWKFGESADDKLQNPEDIESGYDFIEKHAPRTKKGNAQTKWMRLQLCDPKSPIASWSRVDIKDAMASLAAEGNHAAVETEWIITYRHLSSAKIRSDPLSSPQTLSDPLRRSQTLRNPLSSSQTGSNLNKIENLEIPWKVRN